jgi:hypothetical protein
MAPASRKNQNIHILELNCERCRLKQSKARRLSAPRHADAAADRRNHPRFLKAASPEIRGLNPASASIDF